MLVPADPYYTPYPTGMANRINALASVGLVVLLYATVATAGLLAGPLMRWQSRAWGLVPVVCGALLLGAYAKTLDDHMKTWDTAFAAEMAMLGQLRHVVPSPPPDATLITFGAPSYQALGVPVFAASWDLDGAVKIQYNRGDLSAFPMLEGMEMRCSGDAMVAMQGETAVSHRVRYGSAFLIDVPTGRVERPANASSCRRDLPRFAPGPLVAGG
jgi:hypothetical protein